jgi:hypothetical protein
MWPERGAPQVEIVDYPELATTSWLLAAFDTDGEVIFATTCTVIHQVFNGLPNMSRTYFRLRHQYRFW